MDLLQAGQQAQGGGLAAARGADEDQEFLVGDVDVEVVDRNHITELLGHVLIRHTCHLTFLLSILSILRLL
jgi:hypothetical protein